MIGEFPLFVFTTLAGLAAGTYIVSALFPLFSNNASGEKVSGLQKYPWLFSLIMLILLGVGLLGCLGHLQHPERFMNALWNPLAGITQEAYLSMLFGLVLVIDFIICLVKKTSYRVVRIVGAVFGFLLTVVMGFAYANTLGVEAWNTWETVPLFVVGDLAMGFALFPLFNKSVVNNYYIYWVVVVEALFAATLVLLSVHFGWCGLNVVPFLVAIILAPVIHGILVLVKNFRTAPWGVYVTFIAVFVGVAVARYAFYAAYV